MAHIDIESIEVIVGKHILTLGTSTSLSIIHKLTAFGIGGKVTLGLNFTALAALSLTVQATFFTLDITFKDKKHVLGAKKKAALLMTEVNAINTSLATKEANVTGVSTACTTLTTNANAAKSTTDTFANNIATSNINTIATEIKTTVTELKTSASNVQALAVQANTTASTIKNIGNDVNTASILTDVNAMCTRIDTLETIV